MLPKPDHCNGCILSCSPNGSMMGYVPPSGTGDNGVLIVAEAAGDHEVQEGMGLVGKAGHYLFSNLQRVGIERDGFRLANVLSCRPPNNKLTGTHYEFDAIGHCSALLDAEIESFNQTCSRIGKYPVILTLGRIAFKRIMGFTDKSPEMRVDYLCYPFWNDKYKCWVIAADHPSFLMRGNAKLIPVLQFAFKRALEIAEKGFAFHNPSYLRDPDPETFSQWVRDFERYANEHREEVYLAFDIETPHKQGKDEEEVAREDDDDYSILRCSFCYLPGHAVSVPWTANYLPYLECLLATPFAKLAHNANYDVPRISQYTPINGDILDNMVAWHVLNSALPKGLGFITPFYCQDMGLWKHLSGDDPAGYNCQDSDATLRDFLGIQRDLRNNNLWGVFQHHVVKLDKCLSYMSNKGVLRDEIMRSEAEHKLQDLLDVTEIKMESSVPLGARKLKVAKKCPKDLTGWSESHQELPIEVCLSCGLLKPKRWKKHSTLCNGEVGSIGMDTLVWTKPLEFKVSKLGLTNYQKALKHHAVTSRKHGEENKVTFDEAAITRLIKQYPTDPLYPLILEHRGVQKLLSTYVGITQLDGRVKGGMPVGRDGRIRTTYSHNPSTLRLASQQPNLQNLPRPGKEDDLATIIRNLIVAQEGSTFLARDYSGIEAVLVGYFALSPRYIRLAKMDVHSYYTAYALNQLDGRVSTADLPEFGWSDEKLRDSLGHIKKEFKKDRNELYKHLVHGANFMQGPKGAREKIFKETGIEFPLKTVQRVMEVYFELFPEIRKWHRTLQLQAEKDGFLRNPFGYIHRFYSVFKYVKEDGKWIKKPGDDANAVIAFLPQSTAAGIIKEAIMRLYFNRFEEAGQYLRLQVHDEIFLEVPEGSVKQIDDVVKEEMQRSIPELALPASYGMGPMLSIDTEGKSGKRWGGMR